MPAVRVIGQPGGRLNLESDPLEGAEILEDDLEVDMKIAGQFVRPENLERGIVGPRFG